MYSFKSRVRYSETNEQGTLSMESILNYFQDASTFQSEEIGMGIEYLTKQNLVWVLSAWQIVVNRYPKLGETIHACTFPYDFKGFFGMRNYYMEDEEGNKLAYANTIWTLMNVEEGRPVKPTPQIRESYILEERLPMQYEPRKIQVKVLGERQEKITVSAHHLDLNHHVNNGQYISMALDLFPQIHEWRQMRAEYRKSALLGAIIYPYLVQHEDTYTISLCDDQDEIFAVVELKV